MHVQRAIEQLGFKPNEARVYIAALNLGECTVSDIAVKVKLPRTSVQIIIDKLHKDGLINFYIRKRYHYWIAENPEKFLVKIRADEASIRAVLPELNAMRNEAGGKPTIKVFTGAEELKLIHEDILATKHPILAIIAWDDWVRVLGEEYVEDFIERRVGHYLKLKLISPKSSSVIQLKARDNKELRDTRFLPSDIHIENTTFIYANKVALISLNKKYPTGVVIDDPDIKDTMTVFFDELWKQSSN